MTGVELLRCRYGGGRGSACARTSFAIVAVFFSASTIGMAFLVASKFANAWGFLTPSP